MELNDIPYITVINTVKLVLNDKNQEIFTFSFLFIMEFSILE